VQHRDDEEKPKSGIGKAERILRRFGSIFRQKPTFSERITSSPLKRGSLSRPFFRLLTTGEKRKKF
jgi:hypothetical protein